MLPWQDTTSSAADRAAALLADMSLDEKVAQLGSYWAPATGDAPTVEGDVAPMEAALSAGRDFDGSVRLGLGHLTRPYGTEPVTVAEGLAGMRRIQAEVVERSPHGIPAVAHEECLTGFTTLGATVYPASIAWGATWDAEAVQEMARAIGADMHAVGVHQGLSPLLDVVRDYRWGRVEETVGEDPYLVGTIGSAYVRGLQDSGIHATLKHYAGYPASRAGRNHAPVSMGRRELEDVILPPFEMAVRAGTRSVMNSYSDIDGVPAGASVELLTTVLRDRWGFTGTVVSDYWAVTFLELMHHIAADAADAGRLALTAGIDVELPGSSCYPRLADLVRDGVLDEALIDRAALRVLTQKAELGLLDADWDPLAQGEEIDLDSERNRAIARRLADESVILLANTASADSGADPSAGAGPAGPALPLRPGASIALVGPCADEARTFLGCYSYPNHILNRYSGYGIGLPVTSLAEAMRTEFGDALLAVEQGVPILDPIADGIPAAVAAAAAADVAVVAVGDLAGLFGRGTSGEGCDVVDLRLPGLQADLVEAVLATGTPTILLVVSGRPYSLGALAPRCAAVVQAFMPGCEGGQAIAGVLSGRINPSGHLPIGIPNHPGGQPGTYLAPPLGWFSEGVSNLDPRPLYPFGHGLSYTSFAVSDLALSSSTIAVDGLVEVSATVTNTGELDGVEVVQLYAHDEVAQVVRPLKELIGFARVELAAGASARVTFAVHADRLSFTGVGGYRIVEPGRHELMVGTSSENLPLVGELTVLGPNRRVPEGRVLTTPVQVVLV